MAHDTIREWQAYDAVGRRKYLSAAELARFLVIADRTHPQRRAFFYVLAFTGCRISEALALTPAQLDPDSCTLTLKTLKRRRSTFRMVPVPEVLVGMLATPAFATTEPFWPVHRSTAWRWVKTAMRQAAIAGPMSTPKGLRHCFATRAVGKNVPLPLVQRWMGHADLATTAIYLHVVDDEERRFARRLW